MYRYTLMLTQPESPTSPALYYAGPDGDGGFQWTPELLRCKGLHGASYASRLLPAVREWAERAYLGPVRIEVVATYADLHGIASKEAQAELRAGRSASVVEAERMKAARRADREAKHAKQPCRICGKPVKLTGREGRGSACCSALCRVEYAARRRRQMSEYNRLYYAKNRDRIKCQRAGVEPSGREDA